MCTQEEHSSWSSSRKEEEAYTFFFQNYVFFLWPIFTAEPARFTSNSLSALTNSFVFTFDIKLYGKYALNLKGKSKITNFFFDSLLFKSIHTHNCWKHTEVGRTPCTFSSVSVGSVFILFHFYFHSNCRDSFIDWTALHRDGTSFVPLFSIVGRLEWFFFYSSLACVFDLNSTVNRITLWLNVNEQKKKRFIFINWMEKWDIVRLFCINIIIFLYSHSSPWFCIVDANHSKLIII